MLALNDLHQQVTLDSSWWTKIKKALLRFGVSGNQHVRIVFIQTRDLAHDCSYRGYASLF
jgi:hypothetical protein